MPDQHENSVDRPLPWSKLQDQSIRLDGDGGSIPFMCSEEADSGNGGGGDAASDIHSDNCSSTGMAAESVSAADAIGVIGFSSQKRRLWGARRSAAVVETNGEARTNGSSDNHGHDSGSSDNEIQPAADLYPAVTHAAAGGGTRDIDDEDEDSSGVFLELPAGSRASITNGGGGGITGGGEKSKYPPRRVSVADIKYTSISSIFVNDVYASTSLSRPTASCDEADSLDIDSIELVEHAQPHTAAVATVDDGFQQICVEIDSEEATSRPATFMSSSEARTPALPLAVSARRARRAVNLVVICLAKMVDLLLHGTLFGLFIYATYLSVIFCNQVGEFLP